MGSDSISSCRDRSSLTPSGAAAYNTGVAPLSAPRCAFLFSLASRIVPWSVTLTPDRQDAFLGLIGDALAARPPAMQRQFGLFLSALRWAPVVRYLRPFDQLDGQRQDAVLCWFQDCPLALVRSGFWGVRTLIFLGCYGHPDAGARIAYTPSIDGNAVLHARARR
jgi:hypothetical protein